MRDTCETGDHHAERHTAGAEDTGGLGGLGVVSVVSLAFISSTSFLKIVFANIN